MYDLPAYVALERLVPRRTVVVVAPRSPEGPARLLAAGARRVVVVGASMADPHIEGIEYASGVPNLPLATATVDIVVAIDAFANGDAPTRQALLEEARRVLHGEGIFVAWLEQGKRAFGLALSGEAKLDFWAFEDELRASFDHLALLAQIPWQGFSLAPVPSDEVAARMPTVALREGLLEVPPEASHYLALASRVRLPNYVLEECLLVPLGGLDERAEASERRLEVLELDVQRLHTELEASQRRLHDEVETGQRRLHTEQQVAAKLREALEVGKLRANEEHERLQELEARIERMAQQVREGEAREAELEALEVEAEGLRNTRDRLSERVHLLEQRLRTQETDNAILSRTVNDQEQALQRLKERADERTRVLEDRARDLEGVRERIEALAAERQELLRQLDVAVAEREGGRQLASRVEAELELARRKATTQEQQLAQKVEEASRATGELQAVRERIRELEQVLAHTRSRAEQLTASAAQGAEQGRMLAEVALDRDRLRDELGHRSTQIEALEERLWTSREELQKERLENVRLAGQLERLNDLANRSHESERHQARELEQLSAELHKLELEHAELRTMLRTREAELEQLRNESGRDTAGFGDLDALREAVQERSVKVSTLGAELERMREREQETRTIIAKRDKQLSEAGAELERLRVQADDSAKTAALLQDELDVKEVEVDELSKSVKSLMARLAEQRSTLEEREQVAAELQRKLEDAAGEQDLVRRRLREREQELEDLVAAKETSGVEVYKLRQELESAARANEQLEEALRQHGGEVVHPVVEGHEPETWEPEARLEVRRLKAQLAAQARRHAEQLAARGQDSSNSEVDRERIRRFQVEIDVRAQEQEYLLSRLDAAEQQIWEMTDAADRNAARLAASLAQLEKHKELLSEAQDELEVGRNLLAAAQARAIEQERLLGSERARLARAGISLEGLPVAGWEGQGSGLNRLFPDVQGGSGLLDLASTMAEAPPNAEASPPVSSDTSTHRGVVVAASHSHSRMRIEEIHDDESSWPSSTASSPHPRVSDDVEKPKPPFKGNVNARR